MRRRATLLTALAICVVGLGASVARAVFADPASSAANTFSTDTLDPPTTLGASVAGTTVNLAWTSTPDSYAAGHRVLRGTASGGPYTQIAEVTPRTTVIYADAPGTGTFYYVVRAYYQNWESVNSNEVFATVSTTTSTGFRDCSANAAVTLLAGDNDGFQVTPASACADGGAFAEDTDGGTANSQSCISVARDRHLYYDYGFAIPAGATINGIEVRLDAWADAANNGPNICVELSWNGGITWTATRTTPTLTATEATYLLGSSTDTWGRTWTGAEFADANLRVRLTNLASSTARDFRLDWVAVTVTYVP